MAKIATVKKILAALLVVMIVFCGCSSGSGDVSESASHPEGTGESSSEENKEENKEETNSSSASSQEEEPTGVSYDKTLEDMISSAGKKDTVINIEPGYYALDENHTIPENITLRIAKGASFIVASGKTLTIKGAIQADPHHIFRGEGKIAGPIQGDSYVQWFGADTVTSDQSAVIQKAIDACEVVLFPKRTEGYRISHVEINKPTVLRGVGAVQVDIRPTGSEEKLIEISSSNVTVRDLHIVGSEGNITEKAAIYINTAKGSFENILLDNLTIRAYGYGVRDAGSSGTVKNLDMRNVLVDANCNTAIWMTDATTGIDLRDVVVNSFGGPICKGFVFENVKGMYLENCDVNGGGGKSGGTYGDGMTFINCENVKAYRLMIDFTTGKLLVIKNSKKFHFSSIVTSLQAYGEGFYLENVSDSVFDVCKANGDIHDKTGFTVLYMKGCNNNTFNNFVAERSKGVSIQMIDCKNNKMNSISVYAGSGEALQIISGSGNIINGLSCQDNEGGIRVEGTNNVIYGYSSNRVGIKDKITSGYAD